MNDPWVRLSGGIVSNGSIEMLNERRIYEFIWSAEIHQTLSFGRE